MLILNSNVLCDNVATSAYIHGPWPKTEGFCERFIWKRLMSLFIGKFGLKGASGQKHS